VGRGSLLFAPSRIREERNYIDTRGSFFYEQSAEGSNGRVESSFKGEYSLQRGIIKYDVKRHINM